MIRRISCFLFILLLFSACNTKTPEIKDQEEEELVKLNDTIQIQEEIQLLEKKHKIKDSIVKSLNLVDIKSISNRIVVDLKYSSTDNFMKIRLYDTIKSAYLEQSVAQRLVKVQEYLETLQPNYKLVIYDAARPLKTQRKMWDALDTLPVHLRTKFVSNPANKSVHNYGAAVDLSILDESGKELDMGAGYDDIRQIAYPRMEQYFLNRKELTQQQIENRQLLRKVMRSQGFTNIATEWWHFNAHTRDYCKRNFKLIEFEF